jgi:polyhydroxyalkanoate synthesis repressor PhaR
MTEIKKYANRRLYDTELSRFVTLETLAERIAEGEEIRVVDAATGEDITRGVLSQIVLQQGENGQGLLPTKLLEQLIRVRNRSVRDLLERTLPMAVDATLAMQNEFRRMVEARGDKPGLPPEMVSLMFPWLDFTEAFGRALGGGAAEEPEPSSPPGSTEGAARQELLRQIRDLRAQLHTLEGRLSHMEEGGED